jgi:hypothetical protein
MKTTTIIHQIGIHLPKEQVWKKIADFGNICHGHPVVKKSYITSEQKQWVGATRHCDFTIMHATAEERVIAWNEKQNITIEVYELRNMPWIATTTLDLHIANEGDNTLLTATMEYTMKNWFFDIMNTLIMKQKNTSILDGLLAWYKLYIETGVTVDEKTKLDFKEIKKVL